MKVYTSKRLVKTAQAGRMPGGAPGDSIAWGEKNFGEITLRIYLDSKEIMLPAASHIIDAICAVLQELKN